MFISSIICLYKNVCNVQGVIGAHPARVVGDVGAVRGYRRRAPLGRALPARAATSAASTRIPHATG